MKQKKYIMIVLLFVAFTTIGQIHVIPFAGVNSTRLQLDSYGYRNGGNFLIAGIEIEGRLKPRKISPVHFSLVSGASYLANGFFENSQFSIVGTYSAHTIDLTTSYVQLPFVVRLNWQPFPLVEDFHFFMGAGLSYNLLLKAHLAEKTTKVSFNSDIYSLSQTTQYQDSQDITKLGVKNSVFSRIELGTRFKRIQVAFRISVSLKDMYYKGLENVWKIPAKESGYISGHTYAGTTHEKYSELVIGYRIF